MKFRYRLVIIFSFVLSTIGPKATMVHGEDQAEPIGQTGDGGFADVFDGKTLDGWHAVPEECASDWSVEDGVIVGRRSADRLAYLVWKDEQLADFELRLRYRLPGKGNTGVEIRSQVDKSKKRPFEGYHADLGHVGIGPHILGAWDFHFAHRREYPCFRGTRLVIDEDSKPHANEIPDALTVVDIHPHQWNDVRIIARGNHFQFFINDKLASEFTDNAEKGRLDYGAIGLQIHDKGMQVEFKDIRLKDLTAITGSPVSSGRSRGDAPQQRAKFLLLDSRIVEDTENATLTVGTVRKHDANPLFSEDKPWEPRYDNVYANVIYDEEQDLYKCWYSPFVNDSAYANTLPADRPPGTYMKRLRATGGHREMGVCYATSKDGIHWTKPLMDIRRWDDKQPTNIVDLGPHGSGIMKDFRDEDPQRRYKMFMKENGVSVEFSPDGLHWSNPIRCPEIDAAADTHNNAFWAPELDRYVGITRLWSDNPRQRVVGRTESHDFLDWTKAVEVFRGDPSNQIYAMPVFRYADVYIGLPVIFQPKTDRSHTELAWSSDTVHWHRIDPGTPLIPTASSRDAYDWGCVYAAACPILRDDEIRIYYGASNGPHTDWRDGFFALATLRPDGFAGYEPVDAGKPAVVVTSLVSVAGDTLRITADAAGGSIRVSVIDAAGNELATSQSIADDVTDRPVVFPECFILSGHGSSIRLRFELDSAKLYAFSF
jgi:hypothetical protein